MSKSISEVRTADMTDPFWSDKEIASALRERDADVISEERERRGWLVLSVR